jgi:SAM-dependent methyltransferase
MPKMTLDEIRRHWEDAGKAFPEDSLVTPTTRDPFLGRLEEDNILENLRGAERALEVGTGDGAHTIAYARVASSLVGIDVAESLIEVARRRVSEAGSENVELQTLSVLDVEQEFGSQTFDAVVSQRCLINLPDWEHQVEALRQLASVLEPGGRLLITEGFEDGMDGLNEVRTSVGLEPIRTVDYNCNFRRPAFEEAATRWFDIVHVRDYGLYLLLSRVFHPLAIAPEEPKHDSTFNRVAADIATVTPAESLARLSYSLFYVLHRR